MTTDLAKIPEVQGIDLAVAQPIIDAFMPMAIAVGDLAETAQKIAVTDPTDLDGIQAARSLRLKIRAQRIAANGVREDKKEIFLRMGKAIQGIYNRISAVAEPAEARLKEMEDIAERLQAERKAKLAIERTEAIRPYANVMDYPALGNMTPEGFTGLLTGLKTAHDKRVADTQAAELARLEAEFERAEREEEMRLENERLKKEAEEKSAAAEVERKRIDAERAEEKRKHDAELAEQARQIAAERAAQEEARKKEEARQLAWRKKVQEDIDRQQAETKRQQEAAEEKARLERAAAEAIARKEREARQSAERELAEKKRAEDERIAAERKAAEDAAKAPDIEKLIALSERIAAIEIPEFRGNKARSIGEEVHASLAGIRENIAMFVRSF